MAHLGNFDASRIEPSSPFEPIPAGKYLAMVTDSEIKPNKAGTGSYLELVFTIVEGEYKDRKLWARYNLDHPNEVVVKIAMAELSALCRAVGVLTPRDSVELHNLPLVLTVACKKRDDTGEIVNVIKWYERREVSSPRLRQTAPAQATTPPWKR
jgi:hypothetical protein